MAPAVDDLGGHVLGGTAEGVSATLTDFRHSKVDHFQHARTAEQKVLRLQITVENVEAASAKKKRLSGTT